MKYIITIGRQMYSGGNIIGKKLAEYFQMAFYDNELLTFAAQNSGLCKDFFEHADEKNKFNLFGNLLGVFSGPLSNGYVNNNFLRNDSLFQIQSEVIKKLSEEQSCVFVGRCADYILREHPHCIKLFICANLEDRIKQYSELEQLSLVKMQERIERCDKQRAAYYNYYSNKTWGASSSYDLCINTSVLGIERTFDIIRSFVEHKFESWQ